MKRLLFFTCLVGITSTLWSQTDLNKLQQLEEVLLKSDPGLYRFSDTQQTRQLSDTILIRSASSLTNLLNYNTGIYFKENGLGMVSSAAFRGTTAQQTAVIWNGININSQFNGQTDFNTINIRNFDAVTVRSGGGSVLYGSGAIGGSVHLNNTLHFNKGFKNKLFLRYGSFNTWDGSFKTSMSTSKFVINLDVSRASSSNDYTYVNSNLKNTNGQYHNQGIAANVAYKLNDNHTLKFHGYVFDGLRHFSQIFSSETPTKYKDFNTRNLLEWVGLYNAFTSRFKLAYLTEKYTYFSNINNPTGTGALANTVVAKHDLAFQVTDNLLLNSVIDFTKTTAEGASIQKETRSVTSFNLLLKHQLSKRFLYEVSVRQELTENYKAPFLFNAGFKFNPARFYTVTVNGSRNFRMPTVNDLYWDGSGNTNLKPEDAYQIETSHTLKYKGLELALTGFYNDINDLIRWLPIGTNWKPVNTAHVKTYGLETSLGIIQQFLAHTINVGANYSYTVSEDQRTKKQLIYVPNHKATGWFNYYFKNLSAYYQLMYVGDVFILSDNNPKYTLDAYTVSNAGLAYTLGNRKQYHFGIQIKNIFNKNYQSVANRFMPGTNYNIYLNLNF
ncbi:TonB-dependent receptor plug domain-containing protein [Bizionia sediminis]|uniref:TonB-dependent receptor plug domain-containing protein n=1 Tax=Bizionia sediminis TaxID=1737064 RepID=A0ABW5KQR6_9FLAO